MDKFPFQVIEFEIHMAQHRTEFELELHSGQYLPAMAFADLHVAFVDYSLDFFDGYFESALFLVIFN